MVELEDMLVPKVELEDMLVPSTLCQEMLQKSPGEDYARAAAADAQSKNAE
jgi:hypothetical protein